jgi:hypothetical protein
MKHWTGNDGTDNYGVIYFVLLALFAAISIGFFYECLQETELFKPSNFCWDDMKANLIGILFGCIICLIIEIKI